ncbi:MAG: NnrS family protein [Aeromicrobium sp.]|nr:NnrS family protein [Burkholderiales bacterium]
MKNSIESVASELPLKAHFALWNLGFRPFYLLATTFGALSAVIWAAQYSGLLRLTYLHGSVWHALG